MDSTTIREVLSMDEKFSQLSSAVMVHITSLNRGRETRRAYAKCFKGLGEYLQEKEVVYSHEEASLWLSTVRAQVNKTDFSLFTAAINKLNDLYLYGEIQKSHRSGNFSHKGGLYLYWLVCYRRWRGSV